MAEIPKNNTETTKEIFCQGIHPVKRVLLPCYHRDVKDQTTPGSAFVDLRGRNPGERQATQHHLRASNGTANSPSNSAPAIFNPRDITGLKALKAELSKENGQVRIASPPKEERGSEKKPAKGILRPPTKKFPDDPNSAREGVAPLKDKIGIPLDAKYSKIKRNKVNPEALEAGNERYEATDDFVIVHRVLLKDEIQQFANLTYEIRVAREKEEAREIRRRARRKSHERHKGEQSGELPPQRTQSWTRMRISS